MASVGKGSKAKGSNFERKIAKALSEYWGAEFHRTPGSGSLHWQSENNVAGDIVAGPSAGLPFVIECKNQEAGNWTIESAFLGKHNIKEWWSQVVTDSRRVERIPLLIFTRNRAEEFVMIPYEEEVYLAYVQNRMPAMRTTITYKEELTDTTESFDVLITTLKGFTSKTPKYYQELAGKYKWQEEWEERSKIVYLDSTEEEQDTIEDILGKIKNL